jgi:Co/Zn/Cd efflux system component
MAGCCGGHSNFDGMSKKYKRILWWVIAINGLMFFVEMSAGIGAQSQALQADALDFLGDTLTYGISLWVIGKSISLRSNVALFKGYSLLVIALWVFGSTMYRFFVLNSPDAPTMGGIALLAFSANIVSVLLLMRYKDGDANVRSVWLCSRNDAIGNLVVLFAASCVWFSGSAIPDLVVAFILASLFSSSAWQIIKQAQLEKSQQLNS